MVFVCRYYDFFTVKEWNRSSSFLCELNLYILCFLIIWTLLESPVQKINSKSPFSQDKPIKKNLINTCRIHAIRITII